MERLPETFLAQLFNNYLDLADAKALRATCRALCTVGSKRLRTLRASALLLEQPPTLAHLPSVTRLDYNARNAECSHRLLAALQQHTRLQDSIRSVRVSGRDGLLAALTALRLTTPHLTHLEVRCQHSYRGRHAECSDLGRLLRALTASSFPALAHLHLTRLPISGPQLLALCGGLPGLRSLSVRGLTAAAALTCDSLGHLAHMTQLTQLSVDHVLLRGPRFPAGPQLRSLELSDATISPQSFASLNALIGLTALTVYGSGHRAALGFAPLTALTGLRRLHLELRLDERVMCGLTACSSLIHLSAQSARVRDAAAAAGEAEAEAVAAADRAAAVGKARVAAERAREAAERAAAEGRRRSEPGVAVGARVAVADVRRVVSGLEDRERQEEEEEEGSSSGGSSVSGASSGGGGVSGSDDEEEVESSGEGGNSSGSDTGSSWLSSRRAGAGIGSGSGNEEDDEDDGEEAKEDGDVDAKAVGRSRVGRRAGRQAAAAAPDGRGNGTVSSSPAAPPSPATSVEATPSPPTDPAASVALVRVPVRPPASGPLPSLARLTLERIDPDCLPLAHWLPGLRALALDDGGGEALWRAVAAHPHLTALSVGSGATLPPPAMAADAPGGPHARPESSGAPTLGKDVGAGPDAVRPVEHAQGAVANGGGAGAVYGPQHHKRHGGPKHHDHRHRHGHGPAAQPTPPCTTTSNSKPQPHHNDPLHPNHDDHDPSLASLLAAAAAAGPPPPPLIPLPPHLASLRLDACEALAPADFATCAHMPRLTACHVSGCPGLTPGSLVRFLSAMPGLRVLTLDGAASVTDEALLAACVGAGSAGCLDEDGAEAEAEEKEQREGQEGGVDRGHGAAFALEGLQVSAAGGAQSSAPPCSACTATTAAAATASQCKSPAAGAGSDGPAPCPPAATTTTAAATAAAAPAGAGATDSAEDSPAPLPPALPALRSLQLSGAPRVTARGLAALLRGLPGLAALRLVSCQGVCREEAVWLPEQLGRPGLCVECCHASVYDEH